MSRWTLDGNLEAAAKARAILRDMLGEIRLKPAPDGGLWAEYGMKPATLIMSAGTVGRGEAVHAVSARLVRIKVK